MPVCETLATLTLTNSTGLTYARHSSRSGHGETVRRRTTVVLYTPPSHDIPRRWCHAVQGSWHSSQRISAVATRHTRGPSCPSAHTFHLQVASYTRQLFSITSRAGSRRASVLPTRLDGLAVQDARRVPVNDSVCAVGLTIPRCRPCESSY